MKTLVALAMLATGMQDSAQTVRFITCPIYRDVDAGKKSGCWLADDRATGIRYDVSLSVAKPDWNHEVLVEGIVTPGPMAACGGVVLDAVRTSILPEQCPRQMLPAEGFTGRKFVLPKRNLRPLYDPYPAPTGPFGAKQFHLFYDLDRAFLIYQYDDYLIDQAIAWIRAAKPRSITVTGWAATTPGTVSGRAIAEMPGIAKVRAERIAEALVRLGADPRTMTLNWKTAAKPIDVAEADGLAEASRRRVDIVVTP